MWSQEIRRKIVEPASGAKALVSRILSGPTKSCPDTKHEFSAACIAVH
jgi:hypothetical protein